MGHFTIQLLENVKADVRWGTVKKIQFSLFRKNKSESKRGYIVNLSNSNGKAEYRLFKSQNGEWSTDEGGRNPLNSELLFCIQNAILEKERINP